MSGEYGGGIEIQLSNDGTSDNSSVMAQFPFSRGKMVGGQERNELEVIPESKKSPGLEDSLKTVAQARSPKRRVRSPTVDDKKGIQLHNSDGQHVRGDHKLQGNTEGQKPIKTMKTVQFRDDVKSSDKKKSKTDEFRDNDEEHMRVKSHSEDIRKKDHDTQENDWLPHTLVVERQISDVRENKKTGGSLSCGSKRKVAVILAYVMLIGLASWLLQEYFKIPGLYDEIKELSKQIQNLSTEIDRLTTENDRLEGQVDRLEDINDDLEETKAQLSFENDKASDLVSEFNATIVKYQEQNNILREENTRYIESTNKLNQTVGDLAGELATLRESEQALAETVEHYGEVARILESEVVILTNQTDDLNETISELNFIVANFTEENNRFRELNANLRTIVSFLEDEADDVQTSYAELAQHLADTIEQKRVLAEIALKERMNSELMCWECDLETAFVNQDFTISLGYSNYEDVMSYISGKILSDVCIVRDNLEFYLMNKVINGGYALHDITLNDLALGVNEYLEKVLDHYFPGENESGLGNDVWDAANYDCRNLDLGDRYYYTAQS